MLRGLVFLMIAMSIVLSTQAQSLEFETLRTESAPGFFSLRIFPGPDLKPIHTENVYIENFKHKKEAQYYAPIIALLQGLNAKIVKSDQASKFIYNNQYRTIWLGKKAPAGELHFGTDGINPLQDFDTFSETYLGPVYLNNLDLKFGGNVSEVYPARIRFLGKEAVIYGKYERPIKTRLELEASTAHGEIAAVTPLYLGDFTHDPAIYTLADDWDQAHKQAHPKASVSHFNEKWLSLFPWLLFGLGTLLIVMASVQIFRKDKLSNPWEKKEEWWDQAIEETPIYKDWEKNLPFEVVKKEDN